MRLGLDVRRGQGELFGFEHVKKWHSQFAMKKKKEKESWKTTREWDWDRDHKDFLIQ